MSTVVRLRVSRKSKVGSSVKEILRKGFVVTGTIHDDV